VSGYTRAASRRSCAAGRRAASAHRRRGTRAHRGSGAMRQRNFSCNPLESPLTGVKSASRASWSRTVASNIQGGAIFARPILVDWNAVAITRWLRHAHWPRWEWPITLREQFGPRTGAIVSIGTPGGGIRGYRPQDGCSIGGDKWRTILSAAPPAPSRALPLLRLQPPGCYRKRHGKTAFKIPIPPAYGTIAAEVGTHRMLLLVRSRCPD
jgi:hypothetical protein